MRRRAAAELQAEPKAGAGVEPKAGADLFSTQVRWGEAITGGCIEQSNVYDIYDAANGNHVFVAVERSEDCARCCCAPTHSLFVEIKTTAGMQVCGTPSPR